MLDKFIHKTLKRPYNLSVQYHSRSGEPIVFLHGIASSRITWRHVLPLLIPKYQCITVDLLGFGDSPKPDWKNYNLDDHVEAVAHAIKKMRLKSTPMVVGHSMGSLIAARLAKKHPELVNSLVLCSMPLYINDQLAKSLDTYSKTDKFKNNAYFNIYQAIAARPDETLKNASRVVKITGKDTSFRLDKETWLPFQNSLINSIENQTTFNDIKSLKLPITIIYGRFDILVLSKYYKLLQKNHKNISVYKINGHHEITAGYAKNIAKIIG